MSIKNNILEIFDIDDLDRRLYDGIISLGNIQPSYLCPAPRACYFFVRREDHGLAKNAATDRAHHNSLVLRAEFIDLLRGDLRLKRPPMSVRAACDQLKIARHTVKNWRQVDPQFLQAYEDALEDSTDVLEDEAARRAMGVEEDVFGRDEDGEETVIGKKTRYSDDLLKFLLAGRRQALYRPNAQVAVQTNIQIEQPSDRDVAKALSLLIEEAKTKQTA